MNKYRIVFHMTNRETRETFLFADSMEHAEELLIKDGRPFKTFFLDESQQESLRFSINLYNVNVIDYILMDHQEIIEPLHSPMLDFMTLFSSFDSLSIEQIFMHITDDARVAMALRNATDQVKVLILLNVPDERKNKLDEADHLLGVVDEEDVLRAQREIVKQVYALADQEIITLPN